MVKIIKGENLRNAFPTYFNDVYTTLLDRFNNSYFEVESLSEKTIQIKRSAEDFEDDNLNAIDIEFQDDYIEITGYFCGCIACDDETEMTQESDNIDELFEKINEALCFEWGKIAENLIYYVINYNNP